MMQVERKFRNARRFLVAPYGDTRPADFTCATPNDNQNEINLALQTAAALPRGGIVELLDGSFTISNKITPLSYTWLRGAGMFSTKIGITSTANRAILDNYNEYPKESPWTNGIVSDLELDASGSNRATSHKCFNSASSYRCKTMRVYAHDSTATGLGMDDYTASTVTECIVENCGYVNQRLITAASWASNAITFTTSTAHGYTAGSSIIVVTGMIPVYYNGRFVVSTTPTSTTFTVALADNSASLNLGIDPGTATTFGKTSDSLIGHNGVGIASGANTTESTIVTNNVCIGNQNNNFLIEADTNFTGSNASYIYSNNISVAAGMVGYLNTGTPNSQFNNNYDYGSPSGIEANPVESTRTITAASWTGGVATYTTSVDHGINLTTNTKITISGMTPSAYNGYFVITSLPTSTTFTVAMAADPGTATVFGTAGYAYHIVDGSQLINNVLAFNLNYGIKVPNKGDGVTINGNTIKNSYNYGMQIGSGHHTINDNRIYESGRQGLYFVTGSGNLAPLSRVIVDGNQIYNNGKRLSLRDGIDISSHVNAPISHITIQNNQIYDDQPTATQRYGVIVRSGGANSHIHVKNNNLFGNATAGLLLQDTSDTIYARDNGGVNPHGKVTLGNITGSTTFDSTLGNYFTGTLTGNVTAVMPANVATGTEMTWVLTQDGTGGRTITIPANATAAKGNRLTLSTAASAIDVIVWRYDVATAKWREVSRSLASGNVIIDQINDMNGNPWLGVTATASAVTGINITNAISGGTVTLAVTGSGTNSPFIIKGQGSGLMALRPGSNGTNAIRIQDATGSNTVLSSDTSNVRVAIGGTTPASTLDVRGDLTISAANVITDTTTGTKIGTGTTQKLGFFNATPVVQQASTAVADGTLASATTLANALRTAMINLGLIAA